MTQRLILCIDLLLNSNIIQPLKTTCLKTSVQQANSHFLLCISSYIYNGKLNLVGTLGRGNYKINFVFQSD